MYTENFLDRVFKVANERDVNSPANKKGREFLLKKLFGDNELRTEATEEQLAAILSLVERFGEIRARQIVFGAKNPLVFTRGKYSAESSAKTSTPASPEIKAKAKAKAKSKVKSKAKSKAKPKPKPPTARCSKCFSSIKAGSTVCSACGDIKGLSSGPSTSGGAFTGMGCMVIFLGVLFGGLGLGLNSCYQSLYSEDARESRRSETYQSCVDNATRNVERACGIDPCGTGCQIENLDDPLAIVRCSNNCRDLPREGQMKVCERAQSTVRSTAISSCSFGY